MIESDQHTGRQVTLGQDLLGWAIIVALSALNFGLTYVPLGTFQLRVQRALAVVNAFVLVWWFMHLAEWRGTRRFALPVAVVFLLLLLLITMLDVSNRYPPVNPGGIPKVVEPHRPMPSRTQPLGGTEPHRLPGQ